DVQAGGAPARGARVAASAGMPAMPGMAPSTAELRETAPGHYEGSVALSMAGEWNLRLTISGSAGSGTAEFPLTPGESAASPESASPGAGNAASPAPGNAAS